MSEEEVRNRIGKSLRDQLPKLRRLDGAQKRRAAVQPEAFVGDEVEQLVLRDRAAVGRAELIEPQRIFPRRLNRL